MHIARPLIAGLISLFLAGNITAFGDALPGAEQITIQGKGISKARAFAVNDNWHIDVVSDAAIKVEAVAVDNTATTLVNFPEATPAPPVYSGSSAPVAKGGAYTLAVTTTGTWQVTIVEGGFSKNLAIGGSPATPPTPAATPTATTAAAAPVATSPVPASSTPSEPGNNVRETHKHIGFFPRKSDQNSVEPETTADFSCSTPWRISWLTSKSVKITLVSADGTSQVLIEDTAKSTDTQGTTAPYYSTSKPANFGGLHHGFLDENSTGTFHFVVEGAGFWSMNVFTEERVSVPNAVTSQAPAATPAPTAPPTPPQPPAEIVKIGADQARAVVLIKGDNAEGTGFMIKTPDGPAIITNIHVIANNPNLKVTTNTGAFVTVLSEKGASDRDLAMLAIKDNGYNYLEIDNDISNTVQPGDDVITPGNSEGGEVMLNTGGKVKGIGPEKIEIDNPIYHGNSGGPVFHPKSGKVLGVVTEGEQVELSDDLDKTSFASRNSAISGKMRYFALRLDTVTAWIPIDSHRFAIETAFLDQFHEQSRRLDSYLNRPDSNQSNNTSDSNNNDAKLYLTDDKIMKAEHNYDDHASGVDTAQRIELLKGLLFDLQCVADLDVDQIKDKINFYSFDQERAEDEYEYRRALRQELDHFGNNIERLGSLPRTNNSN